MLNTKNHIYSLRLCLHRHVLKRKLRISHIITFIAFIQGLYFWQSFKDIWKEFVFCLFQDRHGSKWAVKPLVLAKMEGQIAAHIFFFYSDPTACLLSSFLIYIAILGRGSQWWSSNKCYPTKETSPVKWSENSYLIFITHI